jgi:hypothetical protein
MKKPPWFRQTLLATALMNVAGSVSFLPQFPAARVLAGLPEATHPLYAWVVALWIFFFGIAYGRLAFLDTQERLFVQIGAAGKCLFFCLLVVFTLRGELQSWALLAGVGDLLFAGLFLLWLYQTRSEPSIVSMNDHAWSTRRSS